MAGPAGLTAEPEAIRSAVGALTRTGDEAADQSTALVGGWSNLEPNYDAPETQSLIDAIAPVDKIGADATRVATEVGAALSTFADDADRVLKQLKGLEGLPPDPEIEAQIQRLVAEYHGYEIVCAGMIRACLKAPAFDLGDISAEDVEHALDAAILGLTVINLAQGGLDPFTDAAEGAVVVARGLFAVGARLFGRTAGEEAAATGLAGARAAGRAGEALAGIVKNNRRIPSASGTAKFRIPDELNSSVLGEVKNVRHLNYTNQLRDFAAYAKQHGLVFRLYTRASTTFSGTLEKEITARHIILDKTRLGP